MFSVKNDFILLTPRLLVLSHSFLFWAQQLDTSVFSQTWKLLLLYILGVELERAVNSALQIGAKPSFCIFLIRHNAISHFSLIFLSFIYSPSVNRGLSLIIFSGARA